ncbi:MAG: CCC motif membrane protein [Chitinophagaceae bacterium]
MEQQNVIHQDQRALPNGTASLVLGILSIVSCFCYGIVGIILGIVGLILANKDLKLYQASPELYTEGSYKNVKIGRICSIIGLALSFVYLILVIAIIASVGFEAIKNPEMFMNN